MKKLITFVAIVVLAQYAWNELGPGNPTDPAGSTADSVLARAFETQRSDFQVQGSGKVLRILSDDHKGSRHQRFVLQLSSGQTVLVAHNIDLAPRISALQVGDSVEFYGEYEWNPRGGVIHWTHHDPQGRHRGGWLKHRGRSYD
jgi:hypothetical protein